MPNSEVSGSESEGEVALEEETDCTTADEKGGPRNQEPLSEYESLRLKRIQENKTRMEALGLRKVASSFLGTVKKFRKKGKDDKRGKRKMVDEDEEYSPTQEDDSMSSSEEENEDDEEFSLSKKKKRVKKIASIPKSQGPSQKPVVDSDFVEDDDALMQAIALSLQDSAGFLDVKSSPQNPGARRKDVSTPKTSSCDKRKEYASIHDDSGKRKRKKPISSRVKMSEDEVLVHFLQFDGSGKGSFTLSDLQRMVIAHDFTWSEKEMADMMSCFDSNGDGKMDFHDFRKIVCRCNMLKGPDDGNPDQGL